MMMVMMIRWIIRIVGIRRIIPGEAPVIARICPIIWSVAIIRIPIWIPAVVIRPAKAEACAKLNCDTWFGRFFNGVIRCIFLICFCIYTTFILHCTGVEIAVI